MDTTRNTIHVNLRVTAEQREEWERLAKADGRTLSSWIRRQVERQLQQKANSENPR